MISFSVAADPALSFQLSDNFDAPIDIDKCLSYKAGNDSYCKRFDLRTQPGPAENSGSGSVGNTSNITAISSAGEVTNEDLKPCQEAVSKAESNCDTGETSRSFSPVFNSLGVMRNIFKGIGNCNQIGAIFDSLKAGFTAYKLWCGNSAKSCTEECSYEQIITKTNSKYTLAALMKNPILKDLREKCKNAKNFAAGADDQIKDVISDLSKSSSCASELQAGGSLAELCKNDPRLCSGLYGNGGLIPTGSTKMNSSSPTTLPRSNSTGGIDTGDSNIFSGDTDFSITGGSSKEGEGGSHVMGGGGGTGVSGAGSTNSPPQKGGAGKGALSSGYNTQINKGFVGGSGAGGRWGGGGGNTDPSRGGGSPYGPYGSGTSNNVDLTKFLPGGSKDPRRGLAGVTGPDGITGPHSNIWQKINSRYLAVRTTLN